MTFEQALAYAKEGKRIQRSGWNGEDMWVAIQRPDKHSMMRCPYLYIKTADDKFVPWTISQTDALTDDWDIMKGTS